MQDNNSQTLFFLGSGNMASAIGRGLVAQNSSLNLGFYDQAWAKALAMTVELPGTKSTRSLPDAVAFADVLLLAVKPQDMPALVDELAPLLRPGQLVLTIAAGLSLAWYQARLPQGTPLVRAMPNTSAAVGEAITGLMAGEFATDAHKTLAEQVFAAVGSFIWLAEEEIHALTAISGSGPAYYYYFTEALAAAGEALGLSPQTAAALARQTAIGAGRLLQVQADSSPTQLREQVTSKGGTTAAALSVFAENEALPQLVQQACRACAERSREMADEN